MGKTTRKCKVCKKSFIPIYGDNQVTCGINCAKVYGLKLLEKEKKKENERLKESILTYNDYVKLLQKYFNTFIRLRDKDKKCISCNRILTGKFDAGHYFNYKSFPNLRIEEDNVHGQCVYCNQHLHGNLHYYREGLIKKIGLERFKALEMKANASKQNLTIDEIKEKINYYKLKIKDYEKEKNNKDQ